MRKLKLNNMETPKFADMKLFESYYPNNNSSFTRVLGGYVYGDMHGCCFIPLNAALADLQASDEDTPQLPENTEE